MNENKAPGRTTEVYNDLSRSVLVNHAKTETTKKKKHVSSNLLQSFLNSKWFLMLFHYFKSRFSPKHAFLTYEKSPDKGIYNLHSRNGTSTIKIALVSDWATDTVESRHIGHEIAKHHPDYSIHLGDTYFVGAPFEIENNFKPGDSFWHYGTVASFALMGNHEMYSNGKAYFKTLLPWMGIHHPEKITQKASYFCVENDYWRIVGLDTGYKSVGIPVLEFLFSKADLRSELVTWLKDELKIGEDNRGLILLTHHQYNSSFESSFPTAARQLAKLIGQERRVLWFWGHEHRFSIYGDYQASNGIRAYGRCIGHGGMPVSLYKAGKNLRVAEKNLVLADNRFCKKIDKTRVGHNGYAILTLENENLLTEYYDENNLLVTEQWQYNIAQQKIEGKSIECYCNELEVMQDIGKAIE